MSESDDRDGYFTCLVGLRIIVRPSEESSTLPQLKRDRYLSNKGEETLMSFSPTPPVNNPSCTAIYESLF